MKLYSLVKILVSTYAGIIRIGIPSKKIKQVQTIDAMATVERVGSKGENENITPFEAALKRVLLYHQACLLNITNWEFVDEEKADIAKHLYFLGAVDCSRQRHNLTDIQFGKLITAFFQAIGSNETVCNVMVKFFLKMDCSAPSCRKIFGPTAISLFLLFG